MKTTASTKPTDEGTLPKRDPKTGRFLKGTAKAKAAKPVAAKAKKAAKAAKPVIGKAKKP